MLTLNNLSSPKGSNKSTKRIGRGQGSGWGTQAGKGHKGQKARSGGGVRTGFEGGSMPLYMRLPKRGFSNAPFKKIFAEVSLSAILSKFNSGDDVTRDSLVERGLLKGINKSRPIKILFSSVEESSASLNFRGIDKFSKNVLNWIEKTQSSIK
tara:strand:- start:463 stop:921 length:459 start_codon:yes stop_codon:yes gene_type:complete